MQIVHTVWGNQGKMLSFLKVLKLFDKSQYGKECTRESTWNFEDIQN
jgi:hypothetical protein